MDCCVALGEWVVFTEVDVLLYLAEEEDLGFRHGRCIVSVNGSE